MHECFLNLAQETVWKWEWGETTCTEHTLQAGTKYTAYTRIPLHLPISQPHIWFQGKNTAVTLARGLRIGSWTAPPAATSITIRHHSDKTNRPRWRERSTQETWRKMKDRGGGRMSTSKTYKHKERRLGERVDGRRMKKKKKMRQRGERKKIKNER